MRESVFHYPYKYSFFLSLFLFYHNRVKSLSKGNSSRRDQLSSSSNLRDSIQLPLSSGPLTEPTFEDNITNVPNEKVRFGWSKQNEKDSLPPLDVDRVPSWRAEGSMAASVYSDLYKGQRDAQNGTGNEDFDYSEQTCEEEKPLRMNNKKVETYQKSRLEPNKTDTYIKQKNRPEFEVNYSGTDEDLLALLKVPNILDIPF